MGICCDNQNTNATAVHSSSQRPRTSMKKQKDYSQDLKYAAFLECDAQGDPAHPKSMYIRKDQVKLALNMQGIECQGDGSGKLEFEIMD